ncbi:hypothetical protein EL26_13955 [Tumebacillus flagellatus]|uniref:Uncharacterized protein n=1 Tax=Tumebacillus flagellatus TaxID=1157490 RepID=A0A074LKL3_9BACL|nr:hypothetical protein EL26_13955 [Tumebacillus flagellatus]
MNCAGEVVRESAAQDPGVEELTWTVQLLNRKAAWNDGYARLSTGNGGNDGRPDSFTEIEAVEDGW